MKILKHLLLVFALLLLLNGCATSQPPAGGMTRENLALSVNIPLSEISLPSNNRPNGMAPVQEMTLQGWEQDEDGGFFAPLPVLIHHHYFEHPPLTMKVVDSDGMVIPHRKSAIHGDVFWTFNKQHLTIHGLIHPPGDNQLHFVYPQAREREARLNHAFSGIKDLADFSRITIQSGAECRSGLLIPAPGGLGWNIHLPMDARLEFSPGLLPPEIIDGPASDGVMLTVEIEAEQKSTEIWKKKVVVGAIHDVEIDLSEWAGRDVTLRFRSQPGPTRIYDYLFVGDPVIVVPKPHPRRVVLIFIDTLRPDHLSFYGYHRNTSPSLAAWASSGLVFSAARSVAPWTLPSLRSAVTGMYPEYYQVSSTLQGRLRGQGWATAMMAGNVYCGPQFDMHRGWSLSRVDLSPIASKQVDRALDWLDTHQERDCFLMVHFMDTHLPYQEPEAYRRLFAGDTPSGLSGDTFHRNEIIRADLHNQQDRQYIRNRYDNNIHYLDTQLARLFRFLGDTDMVVLFSDHGEEFWEHGGFEHGQSLHDELLRVPLIIRAPGISPGVHQGPVSLLDLTPTVLTHLRLDADGLDGRSLIPTASGSESSTHQVDRHLAFGYPLYGKESWGLLDGTRKYVTRRGTEQLFDLDADPGETRNMFRGHTSNDPGASYRSSLAGTLHRPVGTGYMLWVNRIGSHSIEDTVATINVPGGISATWVGDDPMSGCQAEVSVKEDTVVIKWFAGSRDSRTIWIMPEKPVEEITPVLTGAVAYGDDESHFVVDDDVDCGFPLPRASFLTTRAGLREMYMGFGISPFISSRASPLNGYDADVDGMLRALGYVADQGSEGGE